MLSDAHRHLDDKTTVAEFVPLLSRTVLRVQLSIEATFQWKDRAHGNGMRWHIWVEDSENEHIYHSETWLLTKKMMHEPAHTVAFTIPIFEPLPPQYYIRQDALLCCMLDYTACFLCPEHRVHMGSLYFMWHAPLPTLHLMQYGNGAGHMK